MIYRFGVFESDENLLLLGDIDVIYSIESYLEDDGFKTNCSYRTSTTSGSLTGAADFIKNWKNIGVISFSISFEKSTTDYSEFIKFKDVIESFKKIISNCNVSRLDYINLDISGKNRCNSKNVNLEKYNISGSISIISTKSGRIT